WVIDQIQFNEEGNEALLWLAWLDPDTKAIIASEPQQAFARISSDMSAWTILLEDDADFSKSLIASDLAAFDVVAKSAPPIYVQKDVARIYGGYYLPWEAGLTKTLTWSVAHTSCNPISYCTHSFDFADGTMFPISAAKAGIVYHWKDTCANGLTTCTNSITLEDRSTTPWTYQIYLHLAYNSIPTGLKQVGTAVKMGQFIGNVDDTGYSTGHHVHFMVVAADTLYKTTSGYYFGRAEDITFRDVFINWDAATQGGRPRLAYETVTYGGEGQTRYLSGNKKMNPLYEQIFPLFFH
ncbi:MAG: M23 family metallopeptidase, partial [Anaerolineaceae bacterium]|nr:M23 family metallopeptidase [Anaerolineaceae bacterium]